MKDGRRFYAWGSPPNPQYRWVGEQCNRYDSPGGRRFAGPEQVGIGSTPGMETECPDPPPVETPTPDPEPGECGPLGLKLVALCTNVKPCFCDGKDWSRDPVICRGLQKTNVHWTAVFTMDGEDIHQGHACWPGTIPTFRDGHAEGHAPSGWFVTDPNGAVVVSDKDHRGAALAAAVMQHGAQTSWYQEAPSNDLRIDCSWSFNQNYDLRCNDHDFVTRVIVGLVTPWASAQTTMTVRR